MKELSETREEFQSKHKDVDQLNSEMSGVSDPSPFSLDADFLFVYIFMPTAGRRLPREHSPSPVGLARGHKTAVKFAPGEQGSGVKRARRHGA
ncbi:hypothetical protein ElyMa_005055700 [Elysia marginata]|uniref:Uncharacterized protein n=1 Tax=Elysia marginata TaxID=1093978 RepID=A0AAV4JHF6_9GAST|nr:hypothetical protein ElyMa_005055700 [Elysia marginata]